MIFQNSDFCDFLFREPRKALPPGERSVRTVCRGRPPPGEPRPHSAGLDSLLPQPSPDSRSAGVSPAPSEPPWRSSDHSSETRPIAGSRGASRSARSCPPSWARLLDGSASCPLRVRNVATDLAGKSQPLRSLYSVIWLRGYRCSGGTVHAALPGAAALGVKAANSG